MIQKRISLKPIENCLQIPKWLPLILRPMHLSMPKQSILTQTWNHSMIQKRISLKLIESYLLIPK